REDISGVKRDGAQRQGEDITPNQGYNGCILKTSVISPQGRAAQRNEEFAFEMQRFCLCVNVHNDRTHQVRSIPRSHQLSSGSGGCSGQLGNDGPTGSPASIDLHTVMNSPGLIRNDRYLGLTDSPLGSAPAAYSTRRLQHPPPTAPAAYSTRRLQHPPPTAPPAYSTRRLQHPPPTAPAAYSTPRLQHPPPTAPAAYSTPRLQHPPPTAPAAYSTRRPVYNLEKRQKTLLFLSN
ncbi:hypothetical protein KUCAC02_029736, partial [Chaenocephalus aceratus]